MIKINSKNIQKGMTLSDHDHLPPIRCLVEKVTHAKIYTRRFEYPEFWNSLSEWTPEQFDQRNFRRSTLRAVEIKSLEKRKVKNV